MLPSEVSEELPEANMTKKALAHAMKTLMASRPFDKISVIDICKACGMNRKSFYYHFKDKYDLVNWIFYTDFILLVSKRNYESVWDIIQAVVDLFHRDHLFYRAALKIEGQNSFRDYFDESMTPIFRLILSGSDLDEEEINQNAHYMSDCLLAVMNRWLKDGYPPDPKDFTENMQHLILDIAGSIQK